jgi:Mg2+/Co2+ transporter CorB
MNITLVLAGLGILVLVGLSAIFSAAETSLTAASRARLHQLEKDGNRAAWRVNRLIARREDMIGAMLLGNNLINILASAIATYFLSAAFGGAGVVIATGVMTVLILIFAEVLPKTMAIRRPEVIGMALSRPAKFTVWAFAPVVVMVQWVVRRTLKLFGFNIEDNPDVFTAREEIRGAIAVHHEGGLVGKRDRDMLGAVLDLGELSVADVMVHRKNMSMIDADLPPAEIVTEALEAAHTRLPLWRDNPENIIGILHAKDLLRAMTEVGGKAELLDINGFKLDPWFVPETTRLKDQLSAFLKRKTHFALVVDEYGALMGLVTLEDILEEIVGDIDDEHDVATSGVRKQPDGAVHVDGSVTIRDLNRSMDWDLPDEDAVTVAGLVIHEAQMIPEPGQTFVFYGHRFQVLRKRRNQITGVRISPL